MLPFPSSETSNQENFLAKIKLDRFKTANLFWSSYLVEIFQRRVSHDRLSFKNATANYNTETFFHLTTIIFQLIVNHLHFKSVSVNFVRRLILKLLSCEVLVQHLLATNGRWFGRNCSIEPYRGCCVRISYHVSDYFDNP